MKALTITTLLIISIILSACGGSDGQSTDSNAQVIPPPNNSEFSIIAPLLSSRVEQYRNQFHYSASSNWINDPNGLVYLNGKYHMYYQYNPNGNNWGFMSWGHAISTDLVNWQEQDLAIRYAPEQTSNSENITEMIFSGSVIVDHDNLAGFGKSAMLAYYTSYYPKGSPDYSSVSNIQAQSLAYSTDEGQTWTKYSGNPLVDIGSTDFRDPKVFRYNANGVDKWIMVVSLAAQRKIAFYESTNLIDWKWISEFGPANAIAGVWEVPDLFPLAVDGDTNVIKWVLLVSVGSGGAPNGGSGVQYFVSDFDGNRFVSDNIQADLGSTSGTLLYDDFESGYNLWNAVGNAFGNDTATGTLPGQQIVSGYLGDGLINTFLDHDRSTGTLTSNEFNIDHSYINFLIGGGNHPRFSSGGETTFNLIIDGVRVSSATGSNNELLVWKFFDVTEHIGKTGHFEIIDTHIGGWGHINLDHIWFSSELFDEKEGELWADFGADFYAPITFSNMPDNRTVILGWANNWRYAGDIPTSNWRGSMSIARELGLKTIDGKVQLIQQPVREVEDLRRSTPFSPSDAIKLDGSEKEIIATGFTAEASEIEVEFEVGSATEFGIKLKSDTTEILLIGYDVDQQTLFVDRRQAGDISFNSAFPARHEGPILLKQNRIRLKIYIDWSMVEVFGNDGEVVLAERFFPRKGGNQLVIYAKNGTATVTEFNAWELQSIW